MDSQHTTQDLDVKNLILTEEEKLKLQQNPKLQLCLTILQGFGNSLHAFGERHSDAKLAAYLAIHDIQAAYFKDRYQISDSSLSIVGREGI